MTMAKVYVDPGHGGSDPGAIGISNIEEEDITLPVANFLKTDLERHGISVKMSRTGDISKTVNVRVKEANNWGADIFCSIHCNSFKEESANGTETLIYAKGGNAEKIAKKVQSNLVATLKTGDRGIKERPDLGVLRGTKAPAFLSEIAFISNKGDKAKVDEAAEQKAVAVAICKGICSHLGIAYKKEETKVATKKDNTPAEWAKDAVNWAVKEGLLKGDENGDYKLHENITVERFLVFLYRYDQSK